ncbi:hypothetical protein NE619_11740 [Anaerovorax odorimutans]|uniref:Uncharacterized protein n=1 Tax=Anaerovorax odorimutans TaxID=109327 RepID=A0ABT1RQC4_9FIRM|nr:hypothetical protein [Anaerovorax odorimutans]MCQ4637397.1 hypothetical protein [Anaerovorax odorimutans]
MKRIFPFFLISTFIVVFLLFTACSAGKEDAKLSIKESLDANYEALSSQMKDSEDFQHLSDFLAQWAKENSLDVKTQNDQYIVLSKPASAGYEDAETFTVQCSVNLQQAEDKKDDLQNAAAAMALLYSADNHGSLKAIFTLEKDGKPIGASALSDKYLKTDNFIVLDHESDPALYNSIAASSEIIASQKLKRTSPQYTKAYKIQLTGTAHKSPYKHRGDYPNAIKAIGDLLASCKSSSVLFELASFEGGEASDLYPASAEAVIVLQENDVESFTKRFESSFEKIEEYYEDLEEPFTYTMTETKIPDKVLSTQDTDNIVSLMYTITDGTYLKSDDGDVIAASNIGRVTTKKGQFKLQINARSLENNVLDDMRTIFKTTCGLCDIKYKEASSTELWYASDKSPLISALAKAPKVTPAGTLENADGSAFLAKKSDLNMVLWSMNDKSAEKQLQTLIEYMETFGTPEK